MFSSSYSKIRSVACKMLTQLSAELDQDNNIVGNSNLFWQTEFGT